MNDLLKKEFQNSGFQTFQAMTGGEGLQIAVKNSPDIILLDIRLPDVSGFAVIRKLQANAKTKDIPVVLITNYKNEIEVIDRKELKHVEKIIIKYESEPSQVVEAVEALLTK